jgi:hypothetical protein
MCVPIKQRELGKNILLTKSLTELGRQPFLNDEIECVSLLFDCGGIGLSFDRRERYEYFDFAARKV